MNKKIHYYDLSNCRCYEGHYAAERSWGSIQTESSCIGRELTDEEVAIILLSDWVILDHYSMIVHQRMLAEQKK
jgi:hypothetical protein